MLEKSLDGIRKIKETVAETLEVVYLVLLALLTAYNTLCATQIDMVWDTLFAERPVLHELYRLILMEPQSVLLGLMILRFLISKKYDWREWAVGLLLLICAEHAVKANGYDNILFMILMILGARGISFRKIIKVYFAVSLFVTVGVVLGSQIGLIENLVYQQAGRNIRIAFGFGYPTSFAAHIYFLILCFWYLRAGKLTIMDPILPAFFGVFVYIFCEARFTSISLLLMAFVMCICTLLKVYCKKNGRIYRMHPIWSGTLALSPVVCAGGINVLSVLYTEHNQLLVFLDQLITNRLALAQKGVELFGFSLWGTDIRMIGSGGTTSQPTQYFFLDSAYMQFSLQYGLAILALILLMLLFLCCRARVEKQWDFLWILVFVSINGVIEANIFQLIYCPFLLAVFADTKERTKSRRRSDEKS